MHTDTVPEVASIVHKMSVYSVIETIHSSSAVDLVGYIMFHSNWSFSEIERRIALIKN